MLGLLIFLAVLVIFGALTAGVILRRAKYERDLAISKEYGSKSEAPAGNAPSIVPAFVFPIIGIAILILASGITVIEAGHVGVVSSFGKVSEYTLPSGITYVLPVVNNVHDLDTRVQVFEFADIQGATSDLQAVNLTGTVNYRIDGSTAWRLYRDVGEDFANKIFVNPATTDLKTVTPRFTAANIIAKRDEIGTLAKDLLTPQVAPYGIAVEAFYVSNIGLNQAFLDAVEQKQIAQQQVLTQQQITAQKEEQKKQQRIDAEGQADATRALAQGQADANRLLTNSLSPELIQYTLINKLSPTIKTMILPDNQSFILDPKALAGE